MEFARELELHSFFTTDQKTIDLCELALKACAHGGYIVRRGEPIKVLNMHYSRIGGAVRVRVDYKLAVVPPADLAKVTIQ